MNEQSNILTFLELAIKIATKQEDGQIVTLGAIFYELLTGNPITADDPLKIHETLSSYTQSKIE